MSELQIEDELALIKRKAPTQPSPTEAAPTEPAPSDAMAGLSASWQDATTPAPQPKVKTPAEIDAELGLPPAQTGLAPPPDDGAGTWDVLSAAWRAETIKTDAWNDAAVRRRALAEDMWNLLSNDGKQRVWADRGRRGWASMEELITAEAGRQAASSPDVARVWAGYPLSIDDFNRQVDAARKADLDEAQAVLDQPGGGVPEFLGSAARAITDETSLMLLPFGVSGSAWRTIAGEAVLGAAGEAAVLPKEYRVADQLGLADPNPVARIAMGAVTGGAFSAAIIGLGRGFNALKARAEARRASLGETALPGVDRIDHEANVEAAEAMMRGDETVQERLGGFEGGARAEAPPDGTLGAIVADPTPGILPPIRSDAPPNWARIRNGIFAGESGGDYNALFGYQNRKGGKFSNVKLTDMTVDQAIAFADPQGPYGQWVKTQVGRVATPMGAYQIVGTTLRGMKRELGLKGDELMTAEFQEFLGQQIYLRQGTGAWEGYRGPRDTFTPSPSERDAPNLGDTSRGYTGSGQVAAGDDMRIDVDYEVVDYTSLIRASGDLQPRDRSRINSDEWIASTAARLDPAQLMPSPNAATGTPLVGPDNIVESGNGRAAVIGRAYERVPDRAQAYRGAIEAAGFTIPPGVDRPVLIARRRTPLDDAARKRLVIEAQDSGVAQMTPTEVARATARNLQAPILSRLDPSAPLASDANGGFVRAALATLPRSARNAMFDPGGALNANGQRQLREALFARAWPDPDILARYTEGAPAELKSLMEALETAAPSWAALRADIEAGLVTPEMDIGGHVLDAMRLIAAARELSAREGKAIAKAVQELLEDVDMLEGAVAPLTAALVRKMWRGGRAAPADDVAAFLTRYADEARKAGAAGGMFDTPSPRDVLRTIDPEAFADLPEDLGQARGFATRDSEAPAEAVRDLPDQGFDQGAQSPEAEAVHAEIEAGLRGPINAGPAPDPDTPSLIDTRGQGVRYHGSTRPIDRLSDDYIGSEKNFYGQGFYTSDAVAITDGYSKAKKSTTGVIYEIEEIGPVNALNMDQAIPDWFRAAVDTDDGSITSELVAEALAENPANLREFYDAVRELSPNYSLPTYEVQEIFDSFAELVRKNGFNALDHTGGLLTKKTPHAVRIYLSPEATVQLLPVDKAAMRAVAPVPTAPSAAPAGREAASDTLPATPAARDPATAPVAPALEPALQPIDMGALAQDQATRDLARTRDELGEFADIEIDLPDGTTARAGDILDDLDAYRAADAVLQACGITQGKAQ